jgi:hypothetical protein
MLDDLKHCHTMEDVRRQISWYCGKYFGRIEGLRDAIYVVLGIRSDDLAEKLEDEAFHSTDPEELERLLVVAASPVGQTHLSTN